MLIPGRGKQTKTEDKGMEKLTIWDDPYDVMCGDCEVHTYETWSGVTDEELHEMWEMDQQVLAHASGGKLDLSRVFCPEATFEGWLALSIALGYIREKNKSGS